MKEQDGVGALLKQLHDEMERSANNDMRADDITVTQLGTLLILNGTPGNQLTLKELERELRVAQSTAAGIVSRLEQKEMVEGMSFSGDRRVKLVRLTEKGAACCQRMEMQMHQAEARLLSGLTQEEQEILMALLRKVRDSL